MCVFFLSIFIKMLQASDSFRFIYPNVAINKFLSNFPNAFFFVVLILLLGDIICGNNHHLLIRQITEHESAHTHTH